MNEIKQTAIKKKHMLIVRSSIAEDENDIRLYWQRRKSSGTLGKEIVASVLIDSFYKDITKYRNPKNDLTEQVFEQQLKEYWKQFEVAKNITKIKLKDIFDKISTLYQSYYFSQVEIKQTANSTKQPNGSSNKLLKVSANIPKNRSFKVRHTMTFKNAFSQKSAVVSQRKDSNAKDIFDKIATCKSEEVEYTDELTQIKSIIMEIKNELYKIYCNYLENGKNPIQEGLWFTIKEIWKLGKKLNIKRFPKFIDETSVKFSIEYAKREIELTGLQNSKMSINLDLRSRRIHCSRAKVYEDIVVNA